MIVDLDEAGALPGDGRHDVCVIGGGVAGIVLATTLAGRGRRVLLLEAGGLEYAERSQELYTGDIFGREYVDLAVGRLRYLGGTSNHWSGLCRPLDPHDFTAKDHIDGSGWPIGIAEVEPYLAPACAILEVSPAFGERALAGGSGDLQEVTFHESPPVRLLEKYLETMRASARLDVCLNANVTGLELDPESGRVRAALVRGYRGDAPSLRATADRHVLALGGIENARFLLGLADRSPLADNGALDHLGRFFMDHLHYVIGNYVVDPNKTALGEVNRFVAPKPASLERWRIANCAVRIEASIDRRTFGDDALDQVRRLVCESTVFRCTDPAAAGTLRAVAEQIPNPRSRVRLSHLRDRFGLRRVALEWRVSPLDKRTIRTVGLALGQYFALTNIGRIRLDDWVLSDDTELPPMGEGGYGTGVHHMGTTRMGRSPRDGVVDRDCAVFGVPNLHLAGSSVFRTCGHANPTLTIVQLTLRLADHLAPV